MRKRPSSRLIVLNSDGHVLLFRFAFSEGALAGKAFWATPGGALKDGESYAEAARRELAEETGIVADIGGEIAQREAIFQTPEGATVMADERYFLVRVSNDTVRADGQDAAEAQFITAYRWWPLTDLQKTLETVYPQDLAQMIEPYLD
ncbi:MAG: NUDIX hydrolase [Alphaproteobacteria bacterium]